MVEKFNYFSKNNNKKAVKKVETFHHIAKLSEILRLNVLFC